MSEPLPINKPEQSPFITNKQPEIPKKSFNKKILIGVAVVLIVIIVITLVAGNYKSKAPAIQQQQARTIQGISVPTQFDPIKGTVVSINNKVLKLKTSSGTKDFTIADNTNIQDQASMSANPKLETNNLTTSALKPGQILMLQIDKKTNQVAIVVILPPPSSSESQTVVITGTVTAFNQTSISLNTDNNEAKTYPLPGNIQIHKAEKITETSDVKVGDKIYLVLDKDSKVLTIIVRK